MSDSEGESYGFYGKPLEQYDEDAFPKKRPITVEEQIATDAQGRRRFHGAFTGGFSAGFFNTVGSVEGWQPSEFKSSRSEKAQSRKAQKPEDYMDDEDVSEFGIAPSSVKATEDFNTSKKRKKQVFSDGPIPGVPVLQTLIESGNETIGYVLLRNMGLKHADNIEDIDIEDNDENVENASTKRIYSCEMPRACEIRPSLLNRAYKVPELYAHYLSNPKINTFGIGYSGLDKSHINLFSSSHLVAKERTNKKSIAGQAFGVGAFEEEDEDIYIKEDLSKYDFEISKEAKKTQEKQITNLVHGLFIASKNALTMSEKFPPPTIPKSFTGKHKEKRSRFEPIQEETEKEPKRNEINASIRAKYLGEDNADKIYTPSKQQHTKPENTNKKADKTQNIVKNEIKAEDIMNSGLLFDKFVSASSSSDHTNMFETVKPSETLHGTIEMRGAARMKMFGPLTRVTINWLPCPLLCKRFNVPEPLYGEFEKKGKNKRTKNLIFENEKHIETSPIINKSGLTEISKKDEVMETSTSIITEESLENIQLPPEVIETIPEPIKDLDLTEKIDVSKNMDLFKAVFMDSESEESEAEDEKMKEIEQDQIEEEARKNEIKQAVLAVDMLLPKIIPMKQGILSNVGFIKFSKPNKNKKDGEVNAEVKDSEINKSKDNEIPVVLDNPNLYGPKLPEKVIFKKPVATQEIVTIDDEWVEKSVNDDDSDDDPGEKIKPHKHKKKHKKHKKKHKHKK